MANVSSQVRDIYYRQPHVRCSKCDFWLSTLNNGAFFSDNERNLITPFFYLFIQRKRATYVGFKIPRGAVKW